MSEFDPKKDKIVSSIGEVPNTDLVVTVRQYDGGDIKVCIQREGKTGKGKEYSRPAGRLLPQELIELYLFLKDNFSTYEPGLRIAAEANAKRAKG